MFSAVLAYEMLQRCWERCTPAKIDYVLLGRDDARNYFRTFHSSWCAWHWEFGAWRMTIWPDVSLRRIVLNALKYFGVPAAFFWPSHLSRVYPERYMIILGGLVQTRWEALSDVAVYLLGFAVVNGLRLLAVLLALALVLGAIWKLARQKARRVGVFL